VPTCDWRECGASGFSRVSRQRQRTRSAGRRRPPQIGECGGVAALMHIIEALSRIAMLDGSGLERGLSTPAKKDPTATAARQWCPARISRMRQKRCAVADRRQGMIETIEPAASSRKKSRTVQRCERRQMHDVGGANSRARLRSDPPITPCGVAREDNGH